MHLRYPGEIDYIEGVMLDHVVRLLQGKPLYVAPTTEFITLAYMPGYTFAASLVARVFGASFFSGRLVSVLGSLLIGFLVGYIVRRETRSSVFAAGAVGIYCMGYGLAGGGHYDVARPDSLMLGTSLLAFTVLRFTTRPLAASAAALLLVAAFFTKQHAVWFGLAALVHMVLNDRPRLAAFALPWFVGCAGGYALLSAWLGPWFSFYTWDLPSHWSTIVPLRIERYIGGGLLGMLGVLTVPSLLSLGLPEAPWRGRSGLWVFLGLAGFGTGMLATLDPSAWRHVFIPSMMAFSVLGPLSMWRLASAFGPGAVEARGRGVAFVLLSLGFVPLIYPFHALSPHPGAARARTEFVRMLRETPGRVIVVEHGFYGWLAGKGMAMQEIAFGDLERSPGNRLFRRDPRHLEKLVAPLLRGPDRPVLITDELLADVGPLWNMVEPGYRMSRDMGDTFQPLGGVSGHRLWPRYVYTPVDSVTAPPPPASPAVRGTPATP
jgi:MFS family permease